MRRYLPLLCACLAVAALVVVVRQLPQPEALTANASKPPTGAPSAPLATVEQMDLTFYTNGKRMWELRAEKVRMAREGEKTWATGIQRAVYYRGAQPYLTLTADQLQYNDVTKNVEIGGKVTVRGADGLFFASDIVRWDAQERRVVCPGEVKMRFKGWDVVTQRLYLYPDTRKLVCPNPVRVTTAHSAAEGDRLTVDIEKQEFEMENVRMTLRLKRRARLAL